MSETAIIQSKEPIEEGSNDVVPHIDYPQHCLDQDPIHHGLCPSCAFEVIRDARMFQAKLEVLLDPNYVNRLNKAMRVKLMKRLQDIEADR